MRVVLQRVARAEVAVAGHSVAAIGAGYVALVGIEAGDDGSDLDYIARKIAGLRLWPDATGKMNLPLGDRPVLVVSQFTLLGDTRHGMRPNFQRAAPPALARELYQALLDRMSSLGIALCSGVFRADMQVSLVNDGPVTVSIDSRG